MGNGNEKAIVIGGSAGSLNVLLEIFSFLPESFELPIVVVCHLHPQSSGLVELFDSQIVLKVKEATDKEPMQTGKIYFPPADYHLLLESDRTFSLSVDPKVNYARPSIDVFFESAALVLASSLVGIIVTGANQDGAAGIKAIKKYGGTTIAQDPDSAAYSFMPQAAITTGCVDQVLSVEEIGRFLQQLQAQRMKTIRGGMEYDG